MDKILATDSGDDSPTPALEMASSSKKLCTSPRLRNYEDDKTHSNGNRESCETGNMIETPLHPLLDINMIMEKVISYLDKGSLKAATLVCKTWFSPARKLMLEKYTFNFTHKVALEFLEESAEDDDNSLVSVKSDMARNPICVKLFLGIFKLNDGRKTDIPHIKEETALSVVKKLLEMKIKVAELNMNFCTESVVIAWEIMCQLNEDLQILTVNTECVCCPYLRRNLQNVHVGIVDENTRGALEENLTFPNLKILYGNLILPVNLLFPVSSNNSNFFRQIIVSSPALESIHCSTIACRRDLFETWQENPNALQNVKNLSGVTLNEQELQLLSSKGLKLSSLSTNLYSGFRFPALYPFLSSQGKSLETLEIDYMGLPNLPEQFPCGIDLVVLKNLRLKKFFGSIHFVSNMPNLECLTLEDINLSVALHDEATKYKYKSELKSLKIFGGRGSTGRFLLPVVYHDIVSFFPELTHLRMEYFTDSTLKIILKGLPKLEELDIPNGIYSDLIMGVITQSEEHPGETGTSCLTDLQKLRKVVMQSPKITDKGITSGLIHCRELRSVSIDSPMVSDVSLKLLCQRDEILHLEFLNCYQLTSKGISKAKRLWGKGRSLVIANR